MTHATTPVEAPVEPRARDPHRPIYHFLPLNNWLNDPNGLIKWKNQYHMFFQYNPNGPFHGTIHWGHAVSDDLVHWRYLPIALTPTPDSADQDGCWSGCAVDHDGVPTLIYTGVRAEPGDDGQAKKIQRSCLATSSDALLETWEKYVHNPIIAGPPTEFKVRGFRDHWVWREGETWYQIIGSGIVDVGGTVLLYRSHDLRQWEYMHPLHVGDVNATKPIYTGSMWECPQLLFFGERAVLMFSVHDRATLYTAYMVGTYRDHRFTPEHVRKLDYGDRHFYAPQALIEPDGGRLVMWGWCQEARHREGQLEAGWSGVMSIPRVVTLSDDGYLVQTPAPELEALRGEHHRIAPAIITAGADDPLAALQGDSVEISVSFAHKDDAAFGLVVRRSPGGAEQTVIGYDPQTQELFIDRERSSLDETTERHSQRGPLELKPGERLTLRVFLDRSVIEVFANERAYLTSRVYPTRLDSLGLSVFVANGDVRVEGGDVWQIDAARFGDS